jgi:hypothetical protein
MSCVISILADLMSNLYCIVAGHMETSGLTDGPIEHVFGSVSFPLEAVVQFSVPFVGSCQILSGFTIHGQFVDMVGHVYDVERLKRE